MLGQWSSPEITDHIPVTLVKLSVVTEGRQEAQVVGILSSKEGTRKYTWNVPFI